MNVVGPSLSAGLAALQALALPAAVNNAASVSVAPAQILPGVSHAAFSSNTAEAVLGLNAVTSTGASAAAIRVSNIYARSGLDDYARAGIPAERAAWVASLGADSWQLRRPAPLDEGAFEQRVLASMARSGTAKLDGFAAARANGTLKIQHASDMPELGYRSFQLTLYKEGMEFGGVGFGTMNNDRWMDLRRSGTFAATGTVGGNDYVATWPLAWDGDDTASTTAARAAA